MAEFDKIKLSHHQKQNLDENVPGHDYDVDALRPMIENPVHRQTQEDGRIQFFGWVADKTVKAVISAGASAGLAIGRIVTGHRHKLPKIVIKSEETPKADSSTSDKSSPEPGRDPSS